MRIHPVGRFVMASLGLALFCGVPPVHAQSSDPASSSQTATKPAESTAKTPAPAPPEKKKPKKVWTNDEIGSVKGGVSVVGDDNAPSTGALSKPSTSSAEQSHQQQVDSYRDRIRNYQSQIDAIDQRIAQLKNFKADNTTPSGGINLNEGYDMVPLEDQVKQLEEKKAKLQSKLDDTEAEARKNGIEPGELR
jgi:chaperonin cofactor prefoldin